MNLECEQWCRSFSDMLKKVESHTSFCVQIVLHVVFFKLDTRSQTFGKFKRNFDSLLSAGRRINYVYFQVWIIIWVTNPTSPKAVSYPFSYLVISRRAPLDSTICSSFKLLLSDLPRPDETHEEATVWHKSKITNEPISHTRFCEQESFYRAGDRIIESHNHGMAWAGRNL